MQEAVPLSMLSGFNILTRNFRFAPYNYREEKNSIGEKPYLNMQSLVKDVVDAIMRFDNDFILFGHSMGGKIAFEVEKMLETTKG